MLPVEQTKHYFETTLEERSFFMSKKRNEVSAVAAQGIVSDSSGAVATGAVKKRTRKTHDQVWNEGHDTGIRHCVEMMLYVGEFLRSRIALTAGAWLHLL
jgi:hypothetical protein